MPKYIRYNEGTFSALTKQQKEAVGLLAIGTFLEYFDLMLYVHMAVLLNELFFPKVDPHTQAIYSALTFCSTYFLRPIGALVFGYIGDKLGRKITVVISTLAMSMSCFMMANLPTYDQIGVAASICMIICRMIQGISSMGEIIGAEIYVTEISKPPVQYTLVGIIIISSILGGMIALAFAMICTTYLINWRLAFWAGCIIAIVGSVARTTLRESTEFVDAKRRIINSIKEIEDSEISTKAITLIQKSNIYIAQNKIKTKNALAYFLLLPSWSICFYIIYVHIGNLLKFNFGYSGQEVILNNFYVAIINLVFSIFVIFLSKFFHPMKIFKIRTIIFLIFVPLWFYILSRATNSHQLFLVQVLLTLTSISIANSGPIVYKNFPVFKRFTYSTSLYATSKILIYGITSFGSSFLTFHLGNLGLLIITIPAGIGCYWATTHYIKLEKTP